jgi:predicted DNA-binding transcriptional regulator AlpA
MPLPAGAFFIKLNFYEMANSQTNQKNGDSIPLELSTSLARDILNAKGAAQYLDISIYQLYRLRDQGSFPSYSPTGRKLYFLKSELNDWILSKRKASLKDTNSLATKSLIFKNVKK